MAAGHHRERGQASPTAPGGGGAPAPSRDRRRVSGRRVTATARRGRSRAAAALFGVALACAIVSAHLGSVARAQGRSGRTLTYEEERTRGVLEREGLRPFRGRPEGRTVAFVRIVRDDVFVDEDGGIFGWLTWANFFHWLTAERIVAREVLVARGDPYRADRVEESMRNLRDLGIFAYARIVAVEAPDRDEVGLLVYTRDLWSLRFEQTFQVTGTQVDNLVLQLTERNLLGRNKRGTVRFQLVPDSYRIGEVYFDRRFLGVRLALLQSADLIFRRGSDDLEGLDTALIVSSPFYDLDQRYGFDARVAFTTEVERRIQNGAVVPYDIPETPETEAIASVWRQRRIQGSVRGLLRRGERFKQTFGVGVVVDDLHVRPNHETGLAAGQGEAFARDVLPRERRQIGPVLTYELFTPTFESLENLGSYGVTESVRRGPRLEVELRFPVRALASTSDSAVFWAEWGYVVAGHDALLELAVRAGSRLEDGDVVDQRLELELRGATPTIGPLRLVGRAVWEGRDRDTSRELVTLGGDNGLRGHVSQAFGAVGGNLVRANVELRTLPLVLWSVHLGVALFYDVGAVYDTREALALHHAVGVGVRLLFPQFNRTPFRFDFGTPTQGDLGVVPSFGDTQAVPLTAFEDEQEL